MIQTGSRVFGEGGEEYEVCEFVGSGSFGFAYKLKSLKGGKVIALKTLVKPSEQSDLDTFVNEANLAVGIRHPNVIQYYFFHDGSIFSGLPPYILMEFAGNGSLDEMLQTARDKSKAFTNDELREMFKQLVAGMKAVNAKLVHRDIKPANVLVDGTTLKIADFGLAKLVAEATRTNTFKGGGTYPYIAPEGWKFDKNTIQLDIYAMGFVFYELATLRLPFDLQTSDPQKWMEAHLYQSAPSPDKVNPALAPKLSQIILKMMDKSTAKRFSEWESIQQLLEAEEPVSETARGHIRKMLEKRLSDDAAMQTAEAEAEKARHQKAEFCKLVLFQAEQAIIQPVRELTDDFNRQYAGSKAKLSANAGVLKKQCFDYKILFPSSQSVQIQFEVLLPEQFLRKVEYDDYGHIIVRQEIVVPKVGSKTVQGWGKIEGPDGRGFNILLLEVAGEVYGEWALLLNSNGVFSKTSVRPEPFAFGLEQLERQMHFIGVLAKYDMKLMPFDVDFINGFISDYV